MPLQPHPVRWWLGEFCRQTFYVLALGLTLLNANWAAKAAVAGADHQPLTVCPRAKTIADKITRSRLGKHVLPRNALQTEACELARLW